jgi:ferredoxin-NADP reductase/CRP-like cAMP-binding protein
MTDAREALHETPLFERLDDAALDALLASTSEVSVAGGETIVNEGDQGDALYVIVDGAVQIFKQRPHEPELVIARLEAGEYFGEQALLAGPTRVRNASVRAVGPVRLCRIEKSAFQAVLAADHPLKENLLDSSDDQLIANLALESTLFRALEAAEPELDPEYEVAAGTVIFKEGDPSDSLYLVVEGSIEIYREHNEHGERETLATLEPGTSFGELGILEATDRSASARAIEPSRLVVIPASRFRSWQTTAPELRDLFRTLRRVYRLPNRGRLTQSAGVFLGREAITNVYDLEDGRSFVVSLVVGEDLYNADQVFVGGEPPITTVTFADPTRQIRRELQITADRKLAGITVHGTWPALAELQRRMLEGIALDAALLAEFERTGTVAIDGLATASPDALVCSCMRVTRRTLTSAIASGANRLPLLQTKTACGTVCGACLPAVRHLLGNEQWAAVSFVGDRVHPARDVIQLRLRPVDRPVVPCLPGQHVIVSGFIDGEWVQRAYTLSSPCSETEHYEITVKRESDGQFSPWLFDHAGDDTMLRVSPPRGDYWWKPGGRPVVFVVAGIGITPALATVRSAIRERWPDHIHVDCCVRTGDDLAGRDELTTAATASANITFDWRATSTSGRISQTHIDSLRARFPDADFFLCGPEPFMTAVSDMLRRAGVAAPRIRIERFTVAAAPAPKPVAAPPPAPRPPPPREEQRSLRGLFKSLFQRG